VSFCQMEMHFLITLKKRMFNIEPRITKKLKREDKSEQKKHFRGCRDPIDLFCFNIN